MSKKNKQTTSEKREDRRRIKGKATRERILSAALEQFATRGFYGASIRTIARACNVTPALLKYHVGSKQTLYQACLDLSVSKEQKALKTLLQKREILDQKGSA